MPEDAVMLAELMARTFADAFGSQNNPADLAQHLARTYGETQQLAELTNPAVVTLLAEVEQRPAGYAQVREGAHLPACVVGPQPVELWRFYVTQEWIGRGIASLLMDSAKAVAWDRGGRTLWLGVWELNARGIAFYRKAGFQDVGWHTFHVGDDGQTDRVMVHSFEQP